MKKDFIHGVEHLHGNFYKVPFASIITTDRCDEQDNYVFSNPRLLTNSGIEVLTNKDLSKNLRENIKVRTLLTPLICRWVEKDGKYHPQLVGGDRRYRALDYLISKNEMVADPRTAEGGAVPANIAYEYVVCQVFTCENDLEAATLSWAENKNRVDLTEGHEIAAVIELRRFDAADDTIMEILQKDSKWLQETDELISVLKNDDDTFNLLCEDKIKRGAVKKLIEIEDLEERASVRDQAMQMAEIVFEEKTKKFDRQKQAIANKKTRAETKKVFAENTGDEKEGEKAQKILSRVKQREKDIEKNKPSSPRITQKQIEKAAAKVGVSEDLNSKKLCTVKTINSVIEAIQDIIDKEGLVDFLEGDSFVLDTTLLELIKMVLQNHALNNSDDFGETLNDWKQEFNFASSTTFVDDDEEEVRDEEEEDNEDEDEGRPEESDEYEEDEEDEEEDEEEEDEDEEEEEEDGESCEYDDAEEYYDESAEKLLDNNDDEDEDED